MFFSDYTIEANRAIFDERLREADHMRLVNQFRRAAVMQVAAALIALGVVL
jgi:hypothetical protein